MTKKSSGYDGGFGETGSGLSEHLASRVAITKILQSGTCLKQQQAAFYQKGGLLLFGCMRKVGYSPCRPP